MVMCNECHARMRKGAEKCTTTLTRNVHKSVDVSNTWRTQQKQNKWKTVIQESISL